MIQISHYDENIDSLIISSIEDNEKVRQNFTFDDFVISTTRNGKVVSLEIREFSNFLKEMGTDINKIKGNLENMKLIVKPKKELLFIGVGINDNNSNMKHIPIINIPLQCVKN